MAELELREGILMISETDEDGNILFANEDFVRFSGYTYDELKGMPHNIVRHKDVPSEIFETLWKTLKAGDTWRGLLKNKTKQGDFFWAETTISPILKEDGSRRYLAVRQKPRRLEILKYDELYKQLRKGFQ